MGYIILFIAHGKLNPETKCTLQGKNCCQFVSGSNSLLNGSRIEELAEQYVKNLNAIENSKKPLRTLQQIVHGRDQDRSLSTASC